jgi:tetratricopeptide (TPR) repeat protein
VWAPASLYEAVFTLRVDPPAPTRGLALESRLLQAPPACDAQLSNEGDSRITMRRIALWALVAVTSSLSSASAQTDPSHQIEQLSVELKDRPNDALLWYKRGELYRSQRAYALALADYAQAELIEPYLESIYLSRGRVLYESARYPEAYRALTQFLQMAPGHSEALLFRARTRIQLGQPNAAELDFAEALSKHKAPSAELFLERASNLSQQGKATAALTVLQEAIKRLGALAALEEAALAIEMRAKRWPEALRRIETMLPRSERKEQLLAQKAQVLEGAGDKAAAKEARRAALLQIAGLPESQRTLESTRKLAHDLESGIARTETVRRK